MVKQKETDVMDPRRTVAEKNHGGAPNSSDTCLVACLVLSLFFAALFFSHFSPRPSSIRPVRPIVSVASSSMLSQ